MIAPRNTSQLTFASLHETLMSFGTILTPGSGTKCNMYVGICACVENEAKICCNLLQINTDKSFFRQEFGSFDK